MPWRQTSPMDRKVQFIADYLRITLSITAVCERNHVSGQTGDTGIERHLKHVPLGLEERSRQPHSSPQQTPTHVGDAVIELRRHHHSWGAKTRLSTLQQRRHRLPAPEYRQQMAQQFQTWREITGTALAA
jgi:putative transposase